MESVYLVSFPTLGRATKVVAETSNEALNKASREYGIGDAYLVSSSYSDGYIINNYRTTAGTPARVTVVDMCSSSRQTVLVSRPSVIYSYPWYNYRRWFPRRH